MEAGTTELFGLVCPACDTLALAGGEASGRCPACGAAYDLGVEGASPAAVPGSAVVEASAEASVEVPVEVELRQPGDGASALPVEGGEETPMESARHYVCPSCFTPIPAGDKFCGRCGLASPYEKQELKTEYYSSTQIPGRVRLFLLKGRDTEWVSYHLNSRQHVLGRSQGVIIIDGDNWTSPKHACFYYDDANQLYVRDEGSLNGVFVRFRGSIEVPLGTQFAAGNHYFRVEPPALPNDVPGPDGTYFFHGIWQGGDLKVVELLEGGEPGNAAHVRGEPLFIGREDCDLTFHDDEQMELRHVQVEPTPNGCRLTDLGTKNGTFIRMAGDAPLQHGDYVIIGRQLLRVEVTP
ncbi:MAG: FHA domain-containing protein [Myxococcales bacterium]|nr:FHA domain-containing protein [Myxococcales bacterium]